MSFARGFARGFLKQGLEEKAARDQAHAEMVKELGSEFKETSKLFRQEQKDIEKRFKIIEADLGTPAALYASYNGLTTSDAGTDLILKRLNDPQNIKLKNQINEFDFQGYDFNTAKSQRLMNFADTNKDTIELFKKNQGSDKFAEFYLGDIKTKDQVARPDLNLPALTTPQKDMSKFSSYDFKDQIAAEREARQLFFGTEKRPTSSIFKRSYTQGYDAKNPNHGPSKEMYGFRKFFENEFLRNKGVTYDLGSPFTKKTVTNQTTNQNFTQDQRVILAQTAIDQARSAGNDEAVEAIKDQLRKDIGVTNLSELIK